jgi:hypothetical protein
MIESTTNPETRRAFQIAHEERARAIKDAWHWLFSTHRRH